MIDLKTLEAVRNIGIIPAVPEETLDFELGYLEGQNEILDRVVDMLEDQLQGTVDEIFAGACHQRAIFAHFEHVMTSDPAIPLLTVEMEGWKLS